MKSSQAFRDERRATTQRVLAMGLILAIGLLGSLSGGALFGTNDGAGMKVLVSGEYTSEPVPQLFYSSRALAIPLSELYRVLPGGPWYSLLQLVLVLSSMLLLLWQAPRPIDIAAWAGVLLPIAVYAAWRPDYTFTAVVAPAIALIAVLMSLDRPPSRRLRLFVLLAVGITILAASFRPEAALVSAAILLPAWLMSFGMLPRFSAAVFAFLAIPLAYIIHSVFLDFQSPKWQQWQQYNELRGELHGGRPLSSLPSGAPGDWGDHAVRLFESFAYMDEPLFGYESLKRIDELLPPAIPAPGANIFTISLNTLSNLPDYWPIVLPPLLLVIGLGIARRSFGRPQLALLFMAFSYWTLLIIVVGTLRLPANLLLPVTLTIVAVTAALVTLSQTHGLPATRSLPGLGLTIMILGFGGLIVYQLLGVNGAIQLNAKGQETHAEAQRYFAALSVMDLCNSYVTAPGVDAGNVQINPYGSNRYFSLPILNLGWHVTSPPWNERRAAILDGRGVLEALRRRGQESFTPGTCLIAPQNIASDYAALMVDLGYGHFQAVRISDIAGTSAGSAWLFTEVSTG